MNKRLSSLLALVFGLATTVTAQSVNYALENASGNGYVTTTAIHELNHGSELTFQAWINPSTSPVNGELISQDNFSIRFNASQNLEITIGDNTAVLNHIFPTNQWSQLSVCIENGNVKVYVNNQDKTSNLRGSVSTVVPSNIADNCLIGKGFQGRMDEIRIWGKSLNQNELNWRNTLNKFNDNYNSLISYWKCDQDQCENLVDYKSEHHGIFSEVSRSAVEDNQQFTYRIVTGYTNFIRFLDRKNIDRDMFLMTNDLILLSGKVQKDGSVIQEYADNSGVATNVDYISEFDGRSGVMHFKGEGSQLYAEDGDLFYGPDSQFGRDEVTSGTLQGWINIDQWNEGAIILSKRKSDTELIEVSLGSAATKDIVVNVNGTIATLPNKVELNKWHYLSVHLNPSAVSISNPRLAYKIIKIGIDFTVYHAMNAVKLSGNDMTLGRIPSLKNTPIVLGKNFSGKIDNLMVWGSDREGSIQSDANNPYELNIGSWNNLFLNAYWTGDDAQNVGKDFQSYTHMIQFMKDYYANHRGMKIRLGIIYPDGDKWNNVLNQPANVDRMIGDIKKFMPYFDGLDIDLEWHNYHVLNPVLHRIINEVVKDSPEMTFSVSQHYYSYTLDKALLTSPYIDYFTMQVYGPHTNTYTWDYYVNAYNSFIGYGYPKEKLLMSYGILLVDGTEEGYKDLFEKYGMNESNYDPALNSWMCGSGLKYFNGVNQIKRKQEFIIDNDCRGTMYFDMGNDTRVSEKTSLIRAQNDVIAANVDTLITEVKNLPTGIIKINKNDDKIAYVTASKDGKTLTIELANNQSHGSCTIINAAGAIEQRIQLNNASTTINWSNADKGIYMIQVDNGSQSETIKLYKH